MTPCRNWTNIFPENPIPECKFMGTPLLNMKLKLQIKIKLNSYLPKANNFTMFYIF